MFYFHYLRVLRRITQEQLHKRTGINQGHISMMEIGRLIPRDDQVAALASALGIPPSLVMRHVTVIPPTEAAEAQSTVEVGR